MLALTCAIAGAVGYLLGTQRKEASKRGYSTIVDVAPPAVPTAPIQIQI